MATPASTILNRRNEALWVLATFFFRWLPGGPGRRLFVVAGLFFLGGGLSSVFVPVYLYGLGGNSIFFVFSILVVVFVFVGFLPIFLQRLFPAIFPRILSAGILTLGVFQLALAYLHVPFLIGLAWGLGLALFWPPFNTYMFSFTSGTKQTQEMTIITLAIPATASVVGPALGGVIAATLGFVALFLVSAGIFLGAFLLSLSLPPPNPSGESVSTQRAHQVPGFSLFALFFFIQGVTDTGWIVLPLYIYLLSNNALLTFGFIVSVTSLTGAFASPLTGRWADRQRDPLLPAALGFIVGVLWFFTLGMITELWQLVLLSVAGVVGGLQMASLSAYVRIFPRGAMASASTERELFLELGRIGNVALTILLLGSAPLTIALFHRYYLAIGAIAISLPVSLWVIRNRFARTGWPGVGSGMNQPA